MMDSIATVNGIGTTYDIVPDYDEARADYDEPEQLFEVYVSSGPVEKFIAQYPTFREAFAAVGAFIQFELTEEGVTPR
jgi:hypothetical protein